jgi:hypothetical protein
MSTEQEYETQTDMIDDEDVPQSGPGPYPGSLLSIPELLQESTSRHQSLDPHGQVYQLDGSSGEHSFMTQLLDQDEQMLDIDPFGLSASMRFPTKFPINTSSMH